MGRRFNQLGVYSLASVICVILSAPDQLNASSWQSLPHSAVINSRSYSAQTAGQTAAGQPNTGLAGRVRSAAQGIAQRIRGDSVTTPTSMIDSPYDGTNDPAGTPVTIRGRAADAGGSVVRVEVSVDGGRTWLPAQGTSQWSYVWTPTAGGTITILSRTIDTSGNIEKDKPGVQVIATGSASSATGGKPSANKLVAQTTAGPATFTDTTKSDFQLGSTACSVVTHTGDGEVILSPTLSEDFTVFPSTWTTTPYGLFGPGTATVSAGELNVEAAITGPGVYYAAGRTLEFVASFTGTHQAVGFGTTKLDDPATNVPAPYAVFWTDENGFLYARSNDGSSGDQSFLLTNVPNPEQPHLYRIEWFGAPTSRIDFYITDPNPSQLGEVLMTTHAFNTANAPLTMRPIASDHDVDGSILAVDFMRMSPYTSPCIFTSRVFNAGSQVLFATITVDTKLEQNTTLTLCVKTANAAADLAGAACIPGPVIDLVGQYVQYKATLTSTDQLRTPELRSVNISYGDVCPATLSCDDGSACTVDTCNTSTGHCDHTNVVCAAADSCHQAATCSPATGCSPPAPKLNGTVCNDGNACTQTDTCQNGTCTGGNPKTCTASDQCHVAGTCDPGTGACSNPAKANGATCNDGNACTQTDTCQSGVCTGANPKICTASDQCHIAGSCIPATGLCSIPAKADGTACNDNNSCTTGDACQSGVCQGGDTCGRVKITGSGCVPTTRGTKAQFAFDAERKPNNGKVNGHFTYYDKQSGIKVDGKVDTLTRTSMNTATFSGSCGGTCRFTVNIVDNGYPGKDDMISVTITGNGTKNESTGLKKLCGGDVDFHPGGHHRDHDDDHDGHERDDDDDH
jgi:hypothetical protein